MSSDPSERNFILERTQRTLPIALLRAREAVMEQFRPLLKRHDITEQQWRVIRVLHETGPIDATLLAKEACLLAPSLTRILRALAARNYLVQRQDPADGRRSQIELTRTGRAFIEVVAPESAKIYATMAGKIGEARVASLLNEIEDLLQALAESKTANP